MNLFEELIRMTGNMVIATIVVGLAVLIFKIVVIAKALTSLSKTQYYDERDELMRRTNAEFEKIRAKQEQEIQILRNQIFDLQRQMVGNPNPYLRQEYAQGPAINQPEQYAPAPMANQPEQYASASMANPPEQYAPVE